MKHTLQASHDRLLRALKFISNDGKGSFKDWEDGRGNPIHKRLERAVKVGNKFDKTTPRGNRRQQENDNMNKTTSQTELRNLRRKKRAAGYAPSAGSALANAIADALMIGCDPKIKAERLQLRGPNEEDLGGNCRASVIRCIDAVLAQNQKEMI